MRVLVVDDEPQIRRALRLNLDARGYEVIEAATGSGPSPRSPTTTPTSCSSISACRASAGSA